MTTPHTEPTLTELLDKMEQRYILSHGLLWQEDFAELRARLTALEAELARLQEENDAAQRSVIYCRDKSSDHKAAVALAQVVHNISDILEDDNLDSMELDGKIREWVQDVRQYISDHDCCVLNIFEYTELVEAKAELAELRERLKASEEDHAAMNILRSDNFGEPHLELFYYNIGEEADRWSFRFYNGDFGKSDVWEDDDPAGAVMKSQHTAQPAKGGGEE